MHKPHPTAYYPVRLVILAALAVTGGFIAMVGSTGLTQTNKNLCELWRALPVLPAYEKCEFQELLVYLWFFVALLGAGYIFFEIYRWIDGFTKRSARLLAHSILVIFFVAGSAVSIALLIADFRKPSTPVVTAANSGSQPAAPALAPIPPAAPSAPKTTPLDTGPIAWNFNSGTGDAESRANSLFRTASGGSGFWVVGYQIAGTNLTDEQLTDINAYVIPKNTGEKITLQFELKDGRLIATTDTRGIPPHDPDRSDVPFVLRGNLPIPNDGRSLPALRVDEYLGMYGGFKFVFGYSGGKPLEYDFPYSDVKSLLESAQAEVAKANVQPLEIVPKDKATSHQSAEPAAAPKEEKKLIGSATLLFNAEDNTLIVLKSDGIKSVAVEPISDLTIIPKSYVVTFIFYPNQGPFDVRIDGDTGNTVNPPGLFYSIAQNEDKFVTVNVTRSILTQARTHQTWFRFYRKDQ